MSAQKKLASLLGAASEVFASESALGVDLNTMAVALSSMPSEKFSSVTSEEKLAAWLGTDKAEDVKEDKEASEVVAEEEIKEEAEKESADENDNQNEEDTNMSKSAGSLWGKAASQAVRDGLVLDVLGVTSKEASEEVAGAQLTKEQIPDGKDNPGQQTEGADPVSKATLTPEQTPEDSKNHDSGMVAESNKAKTVETKLAGDDSEEKSEEEEVKEAGEDKAEEAPVEEEKVEEVKEASEGEFILDGSSVSVEAAELTAADEEALSSIFK